LAAGLDDHLLGITHIIRGKEHLTNQVRQEFMYKHLGWDYPEAIHYGRLKITGAYLSKSKIVQGIREGAYKGWDDPRLATFSALRRRGITPNAINKMIISVGPKTADVILSWENLYSYNRKTLDPQVDRYFFVQEPVKLIVKHLPKRFQVKLPRHPSKPERGFREYIIEPGKEESAAFWIAKKDSETVEVGKMIRLMELFNIVPKTVKANGIEAHFASEPYEDAREARAQLIHWVEARDELRCEVVMPDATVAKGLAEAACRELKPNTVIQFERFGFARIDEVSSEIRAYYAHK
jgi:glutamyl-tRNA synthetase